MWTVRKWRRCAHQQGRVGISSQLRRPATGPMSTFPHEVREAILHLRKLYPGWGPNTLLAALKTDSSWRDQPLPSRARITTLLKQAGLTRRYQPHHDLIQPLRVPLTNPHQDRIEALRQQELEQAVRERVARPTGKTDASKDVVILACVASKNSAASRHRVPHLSHGKAKRLTNCPILAWE